MPIKTEQVQGAGQEKQGHVGESVAGTAWQFDTDSRVRFIGMVHCQQDACTLRDRFHDIQIARIKAQAVVPGRAKTSCWIRWYSV